MKTLVFVGASHVGAVSDAIRQGHKPDDANVIALFEKTAFDRVGLFQKKNNRWTLSDPFREFLLASQATSETFVVAMFGGNAHNIMGMSESRPPIDFIMPDMETSAHRMLVPQDVIRQELTARMKAVLNGVALLKDTVGLPLYCIEPPPPLDDASVMQKITNPENIKPGEVAFNEIIVNNGLTPEAIRLKLWRLHSSILAAHCSGLDVSFIEAPSEARTSNGFVSRDFQSSDITHGNARYGAMLIDQIAHRTAGQKGITL